MVEKSPNAFRTISEVSDVLEVPSHVLRFWESKFSQIKPVKRGGGRRYYRPTDVDLIRGIRDLLYTEGLTIKGVQKVLKEKGVRHVMKLGSLDAVPADVAEVAKQPAKPKVAAPQKDGFEPKKEELFELAEPAAPPPVQNGEKHRPSVANSSASQLTAEPEIRTLFDDPKQSNDFAGEASEHAIVAEIAKIAENERKETRALKEVETSGHSMQSSKKEEIKRVLGKLESLRDRMKSV